MINEMIQLAGNDEKGGRGCGEAVDEGYYLTGADPDMWVADGDANKASLFMGSGVDDDGGGNIYAGSLVPSIGMVEINPRASILNGEVALSGGDDIFGIADGGRYYSLKERVPSFGFADHVGAKHYTPYQFLDELRRLGPNRKVSKTFAQYCANSGLLPAPVVFFHDKIPVFDTDDDRLNVFANACVITGSKPDYYEFGASWSHDDWGLYGEFQGGQNHMMEVILKAIDTLKECREDVVQTLGGMENATCAGIVESFDNLEFARQPFCASWFLAPVKVSISGNSNLTDEDVNLGISQATVGVAIDENGEVKK